MKKKILLDTNFLVYLAKEKKFEQLKKILEEGDCFIVDKTLVEIKKLICGKFKMRFQFLFSFLEEQIKKEKLSIIKSEIKSGKESVDEMIIRAAKEKKIDIVATFDKDLKKKIKKECKHILIIEKALVTLV